MTEKDHSEHKESHVSHSAKHGTHESKGHAHKTHVAHAHPHAKPHAHKPRSKKKSMNWPAIAIGAVALIIIAYLLFRGPAAPVTPESPKDAGKYGTAEMDFYVMSQCPYGTQVEDGFAPVLKELGGSIDFEINFIASENPDGTFNSLHGEPEVYGNKLHLCAQKHYPKQMMDFIVCQNKKYQDLVGTIEECATEAGIDATKIKTCADGAEGTELLSESAAKATAAQAQGSPTMYLNGQLYQGGRDAKSFKKAVCQILQGHPSCEGIPACDSDADSTGEVGKVGVCQNPGKTEATCTYTQDAAVKMTVVTLQGCADCNPTQLVSVLQGVFLNMEVEVVEADSTEGKAMVKKYKLEKAPSFIFDGGLPDTAAWNQNERIQAAFRLVGEEYVMLDEASGATYLLDETARKAIEKKIGVTKGDNKPQIDFYVMSYCPYGNQAEEGIEPVYQLLKNKADFNMHNVIYSNYASGYPEYCLDEESKYCSMHGVQELNQGIRELCVDKYMGSGKMIDFMMAMNKACNSGNADTCWTGVAEKLDLDVDKIETCEAQEGMVMVKKDQELNQLLGVQGSPTIFVDGAPYNGGRDPAAYAAALCGAFEDAPAECDAASLATLEGAGDPGAAAPAAGACG